MCWKLGCPDFKFTICQRIIFKDSELDGKAGLILLDRGQGVLLLKEDEELSTVLKGILLAIVIGGYMINSHKKPSWGKFKKVLSQLPAGSLKRIILYTLPGLAVVLLLFVAASFFLGKNKSDAEFGKLEKKPQSLSEAAVDPIEDLDPALVKSRSASINRGVKRNSLEALAKKTEATKRLKTVDLKKVQDEAKEEAELRARIREKLEEQAKAATAQELATEPQTLLTLANNTGSDYRSKYGGILETLATVADQTKEGSKTPENKETAAPAPDTRTALEKELGEGWKEKAEKSNLYVQVDVLNTRSTPSFVEGKIGELKIGEQVTELARNHEWSYVQLADGSKVYVYNAYLDGKAVEIPEKADPDKEKEPKESESKAPAAEPEERSGTMYVSEGAVRVREGASTSTGIITTLYFSNEVKITGYLDGWYRVALAEGKSGYIRADLLSDKQASQEILDKLNSVTPSEADQSKELTEAKGPSAPVAPGTSGGAAAAEFAKAQVGKAYVYGSAGPNAFDCSGLVQWAVAQAGGSVGRTTYDQAAQGIPVNFSNGDYSQLAPGDILCFSWGGGISHTGMYIGNNQFVHAMNPNDGIQISDLTASYWSGPLAYVRRVFY